MSASSSSGVLARLARFACSGRVSPESRSSGSDATALQLGDTAIALLAGEQCDEGREIARFVADYGGALSLATVLAATIRLTELDDIHRPSAVTPSAIVVPAAFAVRARPGCGASSSELADAIHVGEELAVGLAMSLGGASMLARGWWPTLTVAPFGAAATAGRLLGLSEEKMSHALALALSKTPPPIGRTAARQPARWLLFGEAVQAGCMAALAAMRGFEADTSLLDDDWRRRLSTLADTTQPAVPGFAAGFPFDVRRMISVKPHPGAKQTMAAIHALQTLLANGVDLRTIDVVEVRVPRAYAAMIQREPPQAGRLASFVSVSGQLALAAWQPEALDDVGRTNVVWHADLQRFIERVNVVPDADLDGAYPEQFPARVCVTADGCRHELTVMESPGDPSLRFDAAQLRDKATRIVGHHPDRHCVELAFEAATQTQSLDRLCEWLVLRFPAKGSRTEA